VLSDSHSRRGPGCGPCQALLPEVAESQTEHANRLTLAVVSDGPPEDPRAGADELGLERALVDEEGKLYRAFKANATPSAVPIAADGTIAGYVESGRDAIEAMVACALEGPLPVGSQVPALELASLDGEPVKLTDLAGRDTLLLLWNPDCGYCRAMHEDVLAWETAMNGHTHSS
jgi:thiol-disulfide isomerase/thioredoxin